MDQFRLPGHADWRRVLLHDPTPLALPFYPLLFMGPLWVRLLAQRPWDPGDAARKSHSWLNARDEVVAEECYI